MTRASVIVPAHNEEAVLGLLLDRLLGTADPGEFEVVVVANGCTDGTVPLAESYGPAVRVLTTEIPSKRAALRIGDDAATAFPRLYVDADLELRADDVRLLCAALAAPGVLAAAPERVFDLTGRSWPVRWYYEVWTRLPEVRRGLFGRGVLAVSAAGHARVAALPAVMADDLAISLAFGESERIVVRDAAVLIRPPRTAGDLLRRRIRVETGTSQLEQAEDRPAATARPAPRAQLAWLRDESSRRV
jgi:glycosyltransferase involved in cell wall biosynthesis